MHLVVAEYIETRVQARSQGAGRCVELATDNSLLGRVAIAVLKFDVGSPLFERLRGSEYDRVADRGVTSRIAEVNRQAVQIWRIGRAEPKASGRAGPGREWRLGNGRR